MRYLPDVNCWLALVAERHGDYAKVRRWTENHPDARLIMVRETKLSLLRLLTNPIAMGDDVLSAAEAWQVVDRLQLSSRTEWASEPDSAEGFFRRHTMQLRRPNSAWNDSWLLSVAESLGSPLLTMDQGLCRRAPDLTCAI